MPKKYYAVKKGKKRGIYETWAECQLQVKGYSGAVFKSFKTKAEAESFLIGEESQITPSEPQTTSKDPEEAAAKIISTLSQNEMSAFVDGSFNSKTGTFGYGVVIFTANGKSTESGCSTCEDCVDHRNVAGEIYGAVYAMKKAIHEDKSLLYLHFDYTGIEHWALGNWKRNNELTKRYYNYYQSIKDTLKVVFVKVEAHTGNTFNEEADKLAKAACGN